MWRAKELFLLLFNWWSLLEVDMLRQQCGGTFTATRGVLQTPNFPGPFAVPMRCQWVIDASNMVGMNTSIVVYLTQLFTFEGLTFTEYQIYGPDYKINPRLVHRVNETNISKVRWVQTYRSYLVVELKLQNADSAHLRVLDKFLDTYGFNITYEMSTANVRPNSCTMMDCGFTGICYDHYTKFSCDCFDGYAGKSCSEGPNSFCYSNGLQTCKNGATCIHVGASAIKCHCTKGYTGNICDTPASPNSKDCSTCRQTCAFDGSLENACKCSKSKAIIKLNPDRPSFVATVHLSNLPGLNQDELRRYLKTQLLKSLQANFSRVEDIEVVDTVHFLAGVDVTLQIFVSKKDEKRVKNILNKWTERGYIGNITISEKDSSVRTLLSLQSVAVNQAGTIRENDEFILSCVARGSQSMTFRWFKDGLFVNVTSTSHKWIKLIKDPHVSDQYTALLAVERAHKYDEGEFTCQVEDFGVQQCMSKYVKIGQKPVVKIEPMSLTVRKGENFTIKCVTLDENGSVNGKYTYSWTKNKELLPVRTENEKYEILYPSGTILQVFNSDKDVKYSCLVQDGFSSSERTVQVHVVPPTSVATCSPEVTYNSSWPRTAPDAHAILDCPKNFRGISTRCCRLKDGKKPTWERPDFSKCTHESLRKIYDKFGLLKLGYTSSSCEIILNGVLSYVGVKSVDDILPGEGARVLSLTSEIVEFVGNVKKSNETLRNVTLSVFYIIDEVLARRNALTNPSELRNILQLLFDQLKMSSNFLLNSDDQSTFHLSSNTMDLTILNSYSIKYNEKLHRMPPKSSNKWVKSEITIARTKNVVIDKNQDIIAGIIFRNISNFMPPKSFLRIADGSELEYEIFSQIVSLMDLSRKSENSPVAIDLKHPYIRKNLNISETQNLKIECAFADFSTFTYTWDIYRCKLIHLDETKTRCVCPNHGIYSLLLTVVPVEPIKNKEDTERMALTIGCITCLILAFSTTACLTISCFILRKSCLVLLKMQCSFSIFLTSLAFSLAVITKPSQIYFMPFATTLEIFLLLAMSSHLSKVLVVFTELLQLPRPVTNKYTVIGIISGVPIIAVFGSHLAHRTMDVKLKSWWLIQGTLAFNIFVAVVSIKCVLFLFLFITVTKKLKELIKIHEKHGRPIRKRMGLLRRSFCIFLGITGYIVSSVIYINNQEKEWSIYQFSATNVILGSILMILYVLKSETNIKNMFRNKSKGNSGNEDKFFSMDSTSSPLNFLSRAHHEGNPNQQLFAMKSTENQPTTQQSRAQSISATFESCLHTSTSFCGDQASSPPRSSSVIPGAPSSPKSPTLESYSGSPRPARRSPDILATKVCVDLDLVASSMCSSSNRQIEPRKPQLFPPKVIITPDDAIQKILENAPANTTNPVERTQPDGHDENVTKEEQSCEEISEDKLLDSISHDLDFLLGKSEEVPAAYSSVNVGTLRKVSKPPGANVIQKIPEELVEKEGNSGAAESITLRTNC